MTNEEIDKDLNGFPFLSNYYKYVLNKKTVSKAEEIVFEIIHDISSRKGLKQEWGNIDLEIKEEILKKHIDIISIRLN